MALLVHRISPLSIPVSLRIWIGLKEIPDQRHSVLSEKVKSMCSLFLIRYTNCYEFWSAVSRLLNKIKTDVWWKLAYRLQEKLFKLSEKVFKLHGWCTNFRNKYLSFKAYTQAFKKLKLLKNFSNKISCFKLVSLYHKFLKIWKSNRSVHISN